MYISLNTSIKSLIANIRADYDIIIVAHDVIGLWATYNLNVTTRKLKIVYICHSMDYNRYKYNNIKYIDNEQVKKILSIKKNQEELNLMQCDTIISISEELQQSLSDVYDIHSEYIPINLINSLTIGGDILNLKLIIKSGILKKLYVMNVLPTYDIEYNIIMVIARYEPVVKGLDVVYNLMRSIELPNTIIILLTDFNKHIIECNEQVKAISEKTPINVLDELRLNVRNHIHNVKHNLWSDDKNDILANLNEFDKTPIKTKTIILTNFITQKSNK